MNVHAYQHRVLMTGTPMQNIKEELWPLMNFIDQSNFPDLQRFQDKYCKGEPGHEVDEVNFFLWYHFEKSEGGEGGVLGRA